MWRLEKLLTLTSLPSSSDPWPSRLSIAAHRTARKVPRAPSAGTCRSGRTAAGDCRSKAHPILQHPRSLIADSWLDAHASWLHLLFLAGDLDGADPSYKFPDQDASLSRNC